MQLVGTGFGGDGDLGAGVEAILSVEIGGLDLVLLDRVDVHAFGGDDRSAPDAGGSIAGRAGSIQVKLTGVQAEPRDRQRPFLARVAVLGGGGRQERDVVDVAAGQRERLDFAGVDVRPAVGRLGLNQRRLRLHRHLLGLRADLELRVEANDGADLQLYFLEDGLFETRGFDLDAVHPWPQL